MSKTSEYWKSYRERKKTGEIRPITFRTYDKDWLVKNNIRVEEDPTAPSGWKVLRYSRGKWNSLSIREIKSDVYRHGVRTYYGTSWWGYATSESTEKQRIVISLALLIYVAKVGTVPSGFVVDHINNNNLDNRVENLQLLTRSANTRKDAQKHNQYTKEELLKWQGFKEVGA